MSSFAPRLRPLIRNLLLSAALIPTVGSASEQEIQLFRYPAIHRDFVVFAYAGDLWRVPTAGGRAWRLTSHAGVELTPKISPDGEWVAYSAEYTGSRQVYVMPSSGGEPRQLTFYNDVGVMPPRGGFDYWIQGWRADGKLLVRMNRTPWGVRPGRYFVVDPAGGLEQPLPIELAGGASYSPDGKSIAYTYFDREFRTWKRYQGGRNQDIWTLDLEAMKSRRWTTWAGSDNFPMWHGDTIYFLSDREHTQNIFAIDVTSGDIRQVTTLDEYDALWPSLGPEAIVFTAGGVLHRLDLETEALETIDVTVSGDLPYAAPRWEDVDDNIAAQDLSPNGKRAVFEARGDLFTVPEKDGPTRNLTDTQGIRESSPSWSADGRFIAYWSDATGEMELYVRDLKSGADPAVRQVTSGGSVWRYPPVWSPDGKKLAFGDSDHHLQIVDVASGAITRADTSVQGDIATYRWSPDSRWIAYEQSHPETELPCLAVYSLESGERFVLGDGETFDFEPAWSADGKHLFFLSNRDYNLAFSDFEFNYVYDNSTRVFVASLDPSAEPLFPVRSDEVEFGDQGGDGDVEEGDESEEPSVSVVSEGFVSRTVALPGIAAGNYANLTAIDGAVIYRKFPDDGGPQLMHYSLEDREEKEIASGIGQYVLAAGGEKVLYQAGGSWSIADAKPGASGEELDLSGLRMKLDPRAEWRQMFDEAWRIGRDWFYDENMHGIDWDAMRTRYGRLVASVAHRSDLDFLLSELVAELEAGHAYVQRGEEPQVDRVEGGMLGAELEADASGRYRFAKIYAGENWDDDWRSPLTEPGVGVTEGDFLLAIDGVELTTADNPYRLLEGKGDQVVELTVGSGAAVAGARTVKVRTLTSELNLRYLDWVRSRAALVDRLSGGRIGYVHLPNTAGEGNRALQKYFYSQSSRDALIVDDRYNGGGFIPDRMIEMLSRTTMSYWARRGLEAFSTPGFAHDGPKAMLINGMAASGGDALPFYFKQAGLGPLVGTRTWGGLIGISGNPQLVDGGGVLYPTFRFFTPEGEWAVEGVGVPPDYEVWDLPEAVAAGGDPSIEKAVELLLEELEGAPTEPASPTPPDMSGD